MNSDNMSSMEIITYYSKNRNRKPFEVTIRIHDKLTFISCNCNLGIEKKFCRHIINAIRGDRGKSAPSTNENAILRLKKIFGPRSTLRVYMEDEWKKIRINSNYNDKEWVEDKRLSLGITLANGFENKYIPYENMVSDIDNWEKEKNIIFKISNCKANILYEDFHGEQTERTIDINEIFESNGSHYIGCYCHLRKSERTFKIERVKRVKIISKIELNKEKELFDLIGKILYGVLIN